MNFHENEEAVSPVIGVILMVAITVILAAVIAVFVFGMAGDVQTTKSVAATGKVVGTNLVVTYQGGADASQVDAVTIKNFPETTTPPADVVLGTVGDDTDNPYVGETGTIALTASEDNHYVVTATFSDGSEQVILQGDVSL